MTRSNRINATALGLVLTFVLSGCAFPGANPIDPPDGTSPEPTQSSSGTVFTDTQRIGKAGIGFVDVPADYVKFVDVDGNDSLQYSNVIGTDIFSLNIVDLSTLSEEERATFTPEKGAENLAARIQEEGATGVDYGTATLAGHNGAKAFGVYPDGTILIMFLIEDDEKKIHYISVESRDIDTIKEMVSLVEDTYAFDS